MKCVPLTTLILTAISSMPSFGTSSNEVLSVIIGDGYVLERLSTGDERELDPPEYSVDENGIATSICDNSQMPMLPGPESSTNALAVALLEMLAYSDVDCFDQIDENGVPYTFQPIVATWTWDGFLGEDETNGWTRAAKKLCFDWYLNFAATNCCAFTSEQTNLTRIALQQCNILEYTNQWAAYTGILRNTCAPHRDLAGELALRYTPEESGLYDMGMGVATNGLNLTSNERYSIMSVYINRLQQLRSAQAAEAVRSLYMVRRSNIDLALSLDRLFDATIAGYGCSSNRLDTALAYVRSPYLSELQRTHFDTITNQLMNAAQPLPEVEALRGL
ncbi:MAG: hypothetical protein ACI4R9_06120 [Kiritimatiellia bacterium]